MTANDTYRAIEAVFRIESPRLIARLARTVGDVGLAEELSQDALVAALKQWPGQGIPDNPAAWLMTAGKHRAIDLIRRSQNLHRKTEEIGRDIEARRGSGTEPIDAVIEQDIGDDLLRLVFTSCHPLLPLDSRVALTLKLLGGLTTGEIARAFLVPEATVAQRIVRAKRALAGASVPFVVPDVTELSPRLASVLEVVYLIFNEGYSASAGDDLMRPGLCEDALRLGRILAELVPREPEVHGLSALMQIQASRIGARTGPGGEPILLLDQNRGKWDQLLIRRGLAALCRVETLGGQGGPYALQAAIGACHARARTAEQTDWLKIAALYGQLVRVLPSPVVELNRAVAVGMAFGPQAGLEVAQVLVGLPALKSYHLLPTVLGDLLEKLGRVEEARAEFERAASLTANGRQQALLLKRAAACRT
ncbi:MAG: RNA polymerase sigma factor [Actinomycetota bacterium]